MEGFCAQLQMFKRLRESNFGTDAVALGFSLLEENLQFVGGKANPRRRGFGKVSIPPYPRVLETFYGRRSSPINKQTNKQGIATHKDKTYRRYTDIGTSVKQDMTSVKRTKNICKTENF